MSPLFFFPLGDTDLDMFRKPSYTYMLRHRFGFISCLIMNYLSITSRPFILMAEEALRILLLLCNKVSINAIAVFKEC